MMKIKKITSCKKQFLELLLLADPCEEMVDRYLETGDMYVLYDGETPVSEAVVLAEAGGTLELMNLATIESFQGKGYASRLVRHIAHVYAPLYSQLLVGTSELGVAFYERLGFRRSFVRSEFFVKNYPTPIYEGGKQCVDMICLSMPLALKD